MQENNQQNLISPAAADRLIRAHDADVALLYIYYLRSGSRDLEQAAAELCRTMNEIQAADEKLSRLGILEEASVVPSAPAPAPVAAEPEMALPQYTAKDIAIRTKEDENFSVILSEGEKVIGRKLNSNDMKVLFGIYDYLALPTEVILVLLNHCGSIYSEKYGEGKKPSSGFIEKEAYRWANREIMSLEQADEYIEFSRLRRSRLDGIRKLLGIHGREFSATEQKDVSAWLDMGFEDEAIAEAYDRTVIKTGGPRWNYMKKIILNWHEKGLHSLAEINEKDSVRGGKVNIENSRSGSKAIDDSIINLV